MRTENKRIEPIFSENQEKIQDVMDWQEQGLIDIGKLSYQHRSKTVIGGDGTLLKTIHQSIDEELPLFGINRGTLGCLMNPIDTVEELIKAYNGNFQFIDMNLISVTFYTQDGTEVKALAFNDVYFNVDPGSGCHGIIRGERYPEKRFNGDGIIISTPQGSTAYNKNAGGMTLPLNVPLFGIQTICASQNQVITASVYEQEIQIEFPRGKIIAHADNADNKRVENVKSAIIRPSNKTVRLAFMEGYIFEIVRYL